MRQQRGEADLDEAGGGEQIAEVALGMDHDRWGRFSVSLAP
jgi:hypothetical protein